MSENPYSEPSTIIDPVRTLSGSTFTFSRILKLLGIALVCFALIVPFVRRDARPAAYRTLCKNNLKHILLALHEYRDVHEVFPPACTVNAEGRPLHSWRTIILPFLDQEQLYDSVDLTKPWNDPINAKALLSMPSVYRCPSTDQLDHTTTYLAVVGEQSFLHPIDPRSMSEISDGTPNTLAVIEVAQENAVPWMSPLDADEAGVITFGRSGTLVHAEGRSPGFTNAAFADGSVRILSADLSPETRRALVSIAGGDKIGEF